MSEAPDLPFWAAGLMILAFSLCFAVGPWLLRTAWRTRGWAEFALGLFACTLPLGNITAIVAARRMPDSLALPALGQLLTVLGVAALCMATWRIYRPRSPWARAAAVLGAAALLLGWAGRVWVDGDALLVASATPSNFLLLGARCAAFAWWAVESLLYARKVGRQERVGVAAAGTSHRFQLLAVVGFGGLLGLGSLLLLALRGGSVEDVPGIWVLLACGITVANVAAYRAFRMPWQPAVAAAAKPA